MIEPMDGQINERSHLRVTIYEGLLKYYATQKKRTTFASFF